MEKSASICSFASKDLKPNNIYLIEGVNDNLELNTIQYIQFDSKWWLVKLSYKVRTQVYAVIIGFVDQFGNIKFSKDNVFHMNEQCGVNLKKEIIEYLADWNKNNL